MDPLTHTLVGGLLARTRLAAGTRLAAPALLIGANLPDVDVASYFAGSDAALGFRRGWTHGWPALLALPCLLWLGLLLWNRARPRPGGAANAPGLAPRRLLACCYLAVASHPCLDWLNTYGMRWRMPLDGTWSYGDSLFIVDPWLWLLLASAWLLDRRRGGRRLAAAGLVAGGAWITVLVGLHAIAESRVRAALAARSPDPVVELMVGPRPANPLAWDVVARYDRSYRLGRFAWPAGELSLSGVVGDARADSLWPAIESAARRQAPGFLAWARFPWLEVEDADDGSREVYLMDARYVWRRTSGFGGARIRLPARAAGDRRRLLASAAEVIR